MGTHTVAVHAGRRDLAGLGVHVPPLDLSTTYPLRDLASGVDSYDLLAGGGRPDERASLVYQRLWNPNVARFEAALAELEQTEAVVGFASGMAAFTAVLLAAAGRGRHVVAVRPLYGGSDHLLASGLLGTTVTWARSDEIADAIAPDTGLIVVETPANPDLRLLDLENVMWQAGDVPVLVDNTFATPVLQQPARFGAELVLHSATKFLGGHGDVIAGAVACSEAWATRLRQVRAVTGGLLHPLAAYLLHRGIQTLPLRVHAAQDNAVKLADRLASHTRVTAVHYPGRTDPLGLIGRQMSGPGAVLSFVVDGGAAEAAQVASACRLITHAVSLGGADTLIQHPASLTHRPVTADAKPEPGLLRVSAGLEDIDDIWSDLCSALDNLGPGKRSRLVAP